MADTLWSRGRVLSACVAVGGLMVLAACSGSSGAGGSDSAAKVSEGSVPEGRAGAFATSRSAKGASATVVLSDRKLVRTAAIGLESGHVDRVLGEIDGVVVTHQGIVESEDVRTDDDGDAEYATLVVRVPVDRFEAAVEDIAGLATLVREQSSTRDVTARVADVDARVDSAERSIAQLRRLFSQATKMGDVIALESELSERQTELESLQARQRALARQTELSTIHVSVTKPDPGRGPGDGPPGFVDGLKGGWSALVMFVRGATHVLGLLLPFGVLATVAVLPALLVVRRSRLLQQRRTEG